MTGSTARGTGVASTQELVARAVDAVGAQDLGPEGWQRGLDQLLVSLEADLGENREAIDLVEMMIVGRLSHRLRIEQWYADPANDPPPLAGPIVIVGLPRTATTALHHLLALDPHLRYPRAWETFEPMPPPVLEAEADDPRRAAFAAARTDDVKHISADDGPIEDGMIHALNFGHQELAFPLPTYRTWWRGADLSTTFAYQERTLRLLHAHRPPYRWLLKAPAYLFHLRDMAQHYPDIRFVMTHRDPALAIPSACSVVLEARENGLPGVDCDPHALGREINNHFAEGMRLAIEARDALGEDRFLDITQEQVEQDPLGVVTQIYEFADLELTDQMRESVGPWAAANRRGARGAHNYTAEAFGMTPGDVREAFADYCDRFTI